MNLQTARLMEHEVAIPAGPAKLSGNLSVPSDPRGIVLFAHGSGSSRYSPRNLFVARQLHQTGMAEEVTDLRSREHRFNISLLAGRLLDATRWIDTQKELHELPIGYFGASTGSAAAIVAAAQLGQKVSAVISRGGRPDLVDAATLARVRAPTLLILGGEDDVVLQLNREAYQHLRCEKRLSVVPGASHLFEEPGTLEEVARLASEWFRQHVSPASLA